MKKLLALLLLPLIITCSKDSDDNLSQLFLERLNGQLFNEMGYDDIYYYFTNENELLTGIYLIPEEDCIDAVYTFTLDGKYATTHFGGESVEEIFLNITLHTEEKLVFEYYYLDYLDTTSHLIMQYAFEYTDNKLYLTHSDIDPLTRDVSVREQIIYEKSNANLYTNFCQ